MATIEDKKVLPSVNSPFTTPTKAMRYKYDKKELLSIRKSPLSKLKKLPLEACECLKSSPVSGTSPSPLTVQTPNSAKEIKLHRAISDSQGAL